MGYNTFVTYTGNGVTTTFAVPFEYISQDEVKATVGGVNASLTFVNPALVQITPAPASGASVVVYRSTKIDSLRSTFQSGTPVPASQLNTNYRQLLNAMQELADFRDTTLPGVQYARTNLGNVPDLDFLNKAIAAGVDNSGGMSGGAISTALNLKADKLNPEFTGIVKVNGSTGSAQVNIRSTGTATGVLLDNTLGTESLSLIPRAASGQSTVSASNAGLNVGTSSAHGLQLVTNNAVRYAISSAGLHSVNGAGTLGVFNVRSTTGAAAIMLDNPSNNETLSFTSRLSEGFAAGYAANATFSIGTTTAHTLQFVANNTIRYTISAAGIHQLNGSGNSGVFNVRATTGSAAIVLDNASSSERLHFTPRAASAFARVSSQNATLQVGSDDANGLEFITNGTYRGSISADGLNVTFTGVANYVAGGSANVYVNPSTGRLSQITSSRVFKKDIKAYEPGGNIDDLAPVFYRVISEGDGPEYAGLIAEEVHDAGFSEFVAYNSEGNPHSVHYPNMVALLIHEVKALRQRVAALEAA